MKKDVVCIFDDNSEMHVSTVTGRDMFAIVRKVRNMERSLISSAEYQMRQGFLEDNKHNIPKYQKIVLR